MLIGSFVVDIIPKKYKLMAKGITTDSVPILPERVLLILFPKNTLIKNPTKGVNTKTKAKLMSIKLSF
jgi:hypothetical protein